LKFLGIFGLTLFQTNKINLKKKHFFFTIVNISIFVLGILILRYSEYWRGQNPLYVGLKMTGWTMFFISTFFSCVHSILILIKIKSGLIKKTLWTALSLMPIIYFSYVFY